MSAGLIETDALDRDGVAGYLNELAENNPELMDHVTSGGGGLLDGLQMRSLLTAGVLAGETGAAGAPGAGCGPLGLPIRWRPTSAPRCATSPAASSAPARTLPTPEAGRHRRARAASRS